MKEYEFQSSICTNREQSERLLALGLKKETADMVWHFQNSRSQSLQWELKPHPPVLKTNTRLKIDKLNVFGHKKADGTLMTGEEYFDELWGKDVPAWSLHRLLELIGFPTFGLGKTISKDYDYIIAAIGHHINEGLFNKDYLEA